jgi:serine/threonine protein kinase
VGSSWRLRDEKADPRADLWAAGVVLYELATARQPFEGKTATTLADAILHASPAAPQSLLPTLSPRLADIIQKCLEKDAENRYQSAKELLVDLRRLGVPTATDLLPNRRPYGIYGVVARIETQSEGNSTVSRYKPSIGLHGSPPPVPVLAPDGRAVSTAFASPGH